MAGFAWADADVAVVLPRARAPVLFFHGRHDDWISPQHSEQRTRLAPAGSRRELSDDNHMGLTMRLEPLGERAMAWFNQHLATDPTSAAGSP